MFGKSKSNEKDDSKKVKGAIEVGAGVTLIAIPEPNSTASGYGLAAKGFKDLLDDYYQDE